MTVMAGMWSRPGWGRYGGGYDARVAEIRGAVMADLRAEIQATTREVRALRADLQALCRGVEEITASQGAICSRLDRLAAATPGVRELRAGVQPSVPRTHESRFRALEFPAQEVE